jgi:hypothetical protein
MAEFIDDDLGKHVNVTPVLHGEKNSAISGCCSLFPGKARFTLPEASGS